MLVCDRVVRTPLARLLVLDDSEGTGAEEERHADETDVLPIFSDDDKYALCRVLAVRVLVGHAPRVFHKRRKAFARSVATDDQNFRRSALMYLLLIRVRSVEPQSLQLALPNLALQFF